MAKKKQLFGELPERYRFIVNPYPDRRFLRCPDCEHATGQRKLPLLICIEPGDMVALNYTCRYCRACDLLIAHKSEIEHYLTELFKSRQPDAIGNPYFIVGTVRKETWREGLQHHNSIQVITANTSDFAEYLSELRLSRPGWYLKDQEPPIWEPPPSEEWVKRK